MQHLTKLWNLLDSIPAPPMSGSLYLGLTIVSIFIGVLALGGRPTKDL